MTTTAYKFDFINASGNANTFQCGGVVGKVDEAIECFKNNNHFATIKKIYQIDWDTNQWKELEEA